MGGYSSKYTRSSFNELLHGYYGRTQLVCSNTFFRAELYIPRFDEDMVIAMVIFSKTQIFLYFSKVSDIYRGLKGEEALSL